MAYTSFADVLCPDFGFNTGCNALKERGTLVRIGSNMGPVYEILAVEDGTAWVREHRTRLRETLVPVQRLRLAEQLAA